MNTPEITHHSSTADGSLLPATTTTHEEEQSEVHTKLHDQNIPSSLSAHRRMMARAMIHHVVSPELATKPIADTDSAPSESEVTNRNAPDGEMLEDDQRGKRPIVPSEEEKQSLFSDLLNDLCVPPTSAHRAYQFPNLRECITEQEALEQALGRTLTREEEEDFDDNGCASIDTEDSIILVCQRRQYSNSSSRRHHSANDPSLQ